MIFHNLSNNQDIIPLQQLFLKTSKQNRGFAYLERQIVQFIKDPIRKKRVAQYTWIKKYVKN